MSQTFTQTRDNLIARALRLARVLAYAQPASTTQITEGAEAFNSFLNHVQDMDITEFSKQWVTKVLVQSKIVVGSDGFLYRCIRSHTSATATNQPRTGTEWSTYWVQDDTCVPDWAAGSAYHVGDSVVYSGTKYTCSAAHEASGSILPTNVAYWGAMTTTWTNAQAYTAAGDFAYTSAFAVTDAFVRYNGQDYPLDVVEMKDAFAQESKNEAGIPSTLFYDRLAGYKVLLDPQPSQDVVSRGTLHLLQIRWLTDTTVAGSTLDLPPTWVEFFTYSLAANIADEAGIATERVQWLQQKAAGMFNQLRNAPYRTEKHSERIKGAY